MVQSAIDNIIEGCEYCHEDLVDVWRAHIGDMDDSIIFLWQLLKELKIPHTEWINIIPLKCPQCSNSLAVGDLLIKDEDAFKDFLINEIAPLICDDIEGCENCNSGKIPYEQKYGDPGNLNTVYDLISDYSIPHSLQDEVLDNIKCSMCGSELNIDDPFVTKREIERWSSNEEIISDIIVKTFGINRENQNSFATYLLKYPMLGLDHFIGQQIFEKIKDHKVPGITKLNQGQILYRARKRDKVIRHVPFIESELWATPLGASSHGRYNPVGVPVLYLADSIKTCIDEIEMGDEEVAEVGEFVLLKDFVVWDVRVTDIKEFVSMPSLNARAISKEYIFPNFLAQCCAAAHIDGIMYGSVKNPHGLNVVMFNYQEERNITIQKINS